MKLGDNKKKLSLPRESKGNGVKILSKNYGGSTLHQLIMSKTKDDKSTVYVGLKQKRIPIKRQAETTKNTNVQNFVENTVTSRWYMGLPIKVEELGNLVVSKAKKQKWEQWLTTYGNPQSSWENEVERLHSSSSEKNWLFCSTEDSFSKDSRGLESTG